MASMTPQGPHLFKDNINPKTYNINSDKIVLLHYDSCNFSEWYKKFINLGNFTNKESIKSNRVMPFKFYDGSKKIIHQCKNNEKTCLKSAKNFYINNKIIKNSNIKNLLSKNKIIEIKVNNKFW